LSLIRRNTLANLGGNAWVACLSLVSVPLVVGILGVESYGLVGFFASLLATLSLLELGLGAAVSRTVAQRASDEAGSQQLHDVLRTVEHIYFAVGAALGIAIVALAPMIAARWLNLNALPVDTATSAVQMMGITLALRWPLPFYQAGLMGMEAQVTANLLRAGYETLRIGGALLCIAMYEASVIVFLGWQAAAALAALPVCASILKRRLPPSPARPRASLAALRGKMRFVAGMGSVTLTGALLLQADKLVLSAVLPLEVFGGYALASAAALTLFHFVSPVSGAVFPRFAALCNASDAASSRALGETYHACSQVAAFLVAPAALVAAFHASDLLWLWVRDRELAAGNATVLAILVIGNALNGLMLVPYALQVAHGWTRLALGANLAALLLMPAGVLAGVHLAGPAGAASAWLALNAAYVLLVVPLTHRRLLRGEALGWYLKDTLPPVAAAAVAGALSNWLGPSTDSITATTTHVAATYLLMVAAAGMATPIVRQWCQMRPSRTSKS
jgi:O-antigen/teichoic acid export membrane protein